MVSPAPPRGAEEQGKERGPGESDHGGQSPAVVALSVQRPVRRTPAIQLLGRMMRRRIARGSGGHALALGVGLMRGTQSAGAE